MRAHYASAVETKQVRAGRDTILGYVERASAVDILAEFVWNSLDAEATAIEVTVAIGDLGAPEELVVTDNGSGMPPDRIEEFFLTHGESWKRVTLCVPAPATVRRIDKNGLTAGRAGPADEGRLATPAAVSSCIYSCYPATAGADVCWPAPPT